MAKGRHIDSDERLHLAGRLAGIVTRTDLIQGLERGVDAAVSQVMTPDPLSVRAQDTAAVAAGKQPAAKSQQTVNARAWRKGAKQDMSELILVPGCRRLTR